MKYVILAGLLVAHLTAYVLAYWSHRLWAFPKGDPKRRRLEIIEHVIFFSTAIGVLGWVFSFIGDE